MYDTGKPYDFRSRSLTRSQPFKGGRGRGKFGLNESMSTYEIEMEIEVGSNTIARNSSFDKFEAIKVHVEEKQMHTGDSITSKASEYDNRRSRTPNDIEISDHDNYAKNRNMPGTSESVVSTEKRSYTDIEEMCAELRRELVNTKKELAETRVRHEAKDAELRRKDEAFIQIYEEINEIKFNFQTRLENTEQDLNRTQQDLLFAQSQIAKSQVVDSRQLETSLNRENIYKNNQEIRYQQNPRYSNYAREGVNDTVLPMVPMATHMPDPSVSFNRGAHRNTNNSDEPKFRIPYFNGKSKFEGFWTVFELGTKKFQWNNQAKIENLWCSHKDDAFACKLSPDVQNNISQFRDALQRRYGDNRLPEQYREDLANIKSTSKRPCRNTLQEKPQSIDDAIEWLNWHECCKGNICKKRVEVRQIETEDQYEHTELIEENEIRKVSGNTRFVTEERLDKKLEIFSREIKTEFSAIENNLKGEINRVEPDGQVLAHSVIVDELKEIKVIIEENEDHKCTLNRGKTVDFNLTNSGNKRNAKVCRDIDIGKPKLSVAFDIPDKLYAVDNVCGDEPDRSKLSVASGQFDDAEINISESSFLDEYVTVDPSVDMISVDFVIDRVRAVTLRVPIVIEGDYLNAVIDTGAEVTVMSQEKSLKIPENRRPQIYRAERNLVVTEEGKKMQTLGMADVSCQIGPLNFIWSVYIAPIGDELLLGCHIIDEHDIIINTKRGLEIKGQWINCDVTRRSDKVARVVLKEAVTIPAIPEGAFAKDKLDLGSCSIIKHKIDTAGAAPTRQPLRRTPKNFEGEEESYLKDQLERGVIKPSSSAWRSNICLVRKKDGSVRWCIDYRKLNESTIKDAYPIPNISMCLDCLADASVFSVMDLQSGYWQLKMAPEDRHKTAFITKYGLF
ncbi:unnamed protein product [Mytilus coruscus]|uniref:Peptidase A2 domain-containing protein n=1 Tax=Mytilus coruscus TaxID=42192 RepID=A0A6J8CI77_MYTCO|nr:unnamed protein product [Mytilus coruscus]